MDGNSVTEKVKSALAPLATASADAKTERESMGQKILQLEQAVSQMKSGPVGGIALPGAEEKFRFANLIRVLKNKEWDGAEYEREVLQQTALRKGYDSKIKAATLGSDVNLGNLIPNNIVSQIVDKLQAQLILGPLGVTMMPNMTGSPIEIRRSTAEGVGGWAGEMQPAPIVDQATDIIQLRPHTAAGLTEVSNKLLAVGADDGAENFIRQALVRVLGRTIQGAFFNGSGVGAEPLGLRNQLGIHSKSTLGALTILSMQKMVQKLRDSDVPSTNLKWAMSTDVLAAVEQIAASPTTQSQGAPILTMGDPTLGTPARILGIPFFTSTLINSGEFFLADWDYTLLADWGGLNLAVSSEGGDAFRNLFTMIRVSQEVDMNVTQPTAVYWVGGVDVPTPL